MNNGTNINVNFIRRHANVNRSTGIDINMMLNKDSIINAHMDAFEVLDWLMCLHGSMS